MSGGSLTRMWPAAIVAAAGAVAALGVGHASPALLAPSGRYPLRVDLPPSKPLPPLRALALSPEDQAQSPAAAPQAAVAADPTAPGLPDGFAPAFAEAVPAEVASAQIPPATPVDELLSVHFNLADPYDPAARTGEAGAPIELKKSVRLNGSDAGDATIRVTDGATIAISNDQLGKLLSSAGRGDVAEKLAAAGPFVSFDRIRQAGLSVRYDAASDRIVLSS